MFVRFAQFLIMLAPIGLFGWLLYQELVPTGVFQIFHHVGEPSPFIDRVLPDQRVEDVRTDTDGDRVRAITGDPAFFFVHPHRGFNKVDAEIWFKNQDNPIVELGGLARIDPEVYDLQPLQNRIIDELNWASQQEGETILLQRNPTYRSLTEFVNNPPPRHEIATYHYDIEKPYLIPGYQPSARQRTIDASLRGFHEFKTYIKNEELNVDFMYMDMNRAEGGDEILVLVFNHAGHVVGEVRMQDDGNTSDDAIPSERTNFSLRIPDLPEGVYKVELRAGRDIFFRTLTTTQQKIVFLNNLYLGDQIAYREPGESIAFWTEAKELAFQTQHVEGLQDVTIGGSTVTVNEPYTRVAHFVPEDGVVKVLSPNADLIVHSNGHIAFSPDQFFNPDPIPLSPTTDLDKLDVNYVIANYIPPEERGNWFVKTVSFDPQILQYLDEGTWKFVFSIPGIEDRQTKFDLGAMNFTMHREPFELSDLLEIMP